MNTPPGTPPPPAQPSIPTLLETLRATALVDPEVQAAIEALPEVKGGDVNRFAKVIYDRRWLTRYQLAQLAIGRIDNLVLGQYHLLEKIGEGGFGAVFKALHPMMNRIVALKRIRRERLANANAEKRFFREVQAAARLEHPNIVRAYDAGQVGNIAYLVMEYVDGIDLSRLVKESGPLTVQQACDYVRQAALGLQCAHERGLIHRDIKPSNVLVTPVIRDGDDGPVSPAAHAVAKLLDMGLARIDAGDEDQFGAAISNVTHRDFSVTRDNQIVGTPDYLAPEQIDNPKGIDIRADLYSLGCTFYYLLAAHPPFPSTTLKELLDKHRYREPAPIDLERRDVPNNVADIVHKLLAKRPEERYREPRALAEALAAIKLPSRPVGVARPINTPPFVKEESFEVVEEADAVPARGEVTPPEHHGSDTATNLDEPFPAEVWTPPPRSAAKTLKRKKKPTGGTWLGIGLLLHLVGIVILAIVLTGQGAAIRKMLFGAPAVVEEPPRPEIKHQAEPPRNKAQTKVVRDPKWLPTPAKKEEPPPPKPVDEPPPTPMPMPTPPKPMPVDEPPTPPPPPTPVVRLPRWVSDGKAGALSALALSHDGKVLVSTGEDRAVRFWDVESGKELNSYPRFGSGAVALNPKGDKFASLEGVGVWKPRDIVAGPPTMTKFAEHTGTVMALAVSPDGRRWVSGGSDGMVGIWDYTVSLKCVQITKAHRGAVRGIDHSKIEKQAASIGDDMTLRLWDTDKGKELRKFENVGVLLKGVRYRPNGDGLLVLSARGMTLHDPNSGTVRTTFKVPFDLELSCAAWLPDSSKLLTNGPGCLIIWDATTGEEVGRLEGATGTISAVDVAPSGRVVAGGRNIWIWDAP